MRRQERGGRIENRKTHSLRIFTAKRGAGRRKGREGEGENEEGGGLRGYHGENAKTTFLGGFSPCKEGQTKKRGKRKGTRRKGRGSRGRVEGGHTV